MANKGAFKKGDGRARKPKGAVSEKVKFWNQLEDWMINEGCEKFKQELMKLSGKDFVTHYGMSLEYFKPKLSRSEVKQQTDTILTITRKVINKDGTGA